MNAVQPLPTCRMDDVRPVTPRENVLRSDTTVSALALAKTHCKHGHLFDERNTYYTKQGWRQCRRCHVRQQTELNRRKRTKKREEKDKCH